VIFDYAHNAHAVGAMADLAGRLDVRGRRLVVVAGPGDRRDEDLRDIALAVAGRFDHYICRRDDSLRGRAPDEVPQLIAAVLREQGVPAEAISVIPDEQAAIDAALHMARRGDLLLIFGDALTRSWKQIIRFRADEAGEGRPGMAGSEAMAPATPAVPRPLPEAGTVAGAPPAGSVAVPVGAQAEAPAAIAGAAAEPGDKGGAGPLALDDPLEAAGFVRDSRGLRYVGEPAD
jgi:cyanophycin synthetase